MNKLLFLLFASSLAFTFTSCGDPDTPDDETEEVITTLNYTLTSSTGETVLMSFQDLDGDGGMEPTISGATLAANEIYTGSMELLNESLPETEDITEEIREEDDEHQLFFTSTVPGLTVTYNDEDDNNNPVGLATTLSTAAAGTGALTITLRHKPDKSADGVSTGTIANAGGETDIEVSFNIDVQ